MTPFDRCGFKTYSEYQVKRHQEIRHYAKKKLLYVGDDIIQNVDYRHLEKEAKAFIKPLKAYSAANVELNDILSSKPQHPEQNYKDVVLNELLNDEYSYLVLGSCTEDLSNLKTCEDPSEKLDELEDIVLNSAKSMFSLAETALSSFPKLKKVVLMMMPPGLTPPPVTPWASSPSLWVSLIPSTLNFGQGANFATELLSVIMNFPEPWAMNTNWSMATLLMLTMMVSR